jgi:hypothetical protein
MKVYFMSKMLIGDLSKTQLQIISEFREIEDSVLANVHTVLRRLEFQKITAHQTQVHLRRS